MSEAVLSGSAMLPRNITLSCEQTPSVPKDVIWEGRFFPQPDHHGPSVALAQTAATEDMSPPQQVLCGLERALRGPVPRASAALLTSACV